MRSFRHLLSPVVSGFSAFVIGMASLALSASALADPPSRVARLAYVSGAISFSPSGLDDWVQAGINRPLTTGDKLWADNAARAELELGDAAVRLGQNTSMTMLHLDDAVAQMQLTQGTLNLRIRGMGPDQSFEVDTPNLAFSIRQPGSYRIQVEPDGSATTVAVHAGQGEAYGEGHALVIDQGHVDRFVGTSLNDYTSLAFAPPDDFDRWSGERDHRWDASVSARYVPHAMIGYEDLDTYGTWRNVDGYGNVWTPSSVATDWAPYRDGHWAWIEPWGWTWVDDTPWGFAPSHYGRWAYIDRRWGWIPGPVVVRPVYAPAMVAFVGGSGISVVAWFALGPRDVYRPSYPVSQGYFTRVNTSNTVINTTNVTNVYNNTNVTRVVYANRQVPGAVVAVPSAAFQQGRPVGRQAEHVNREALANAAVALQAPVKPTRINVLGGAPASERRPPQSMAATKPILTRVTPVSLSAQAHETGKRENGTQPRFIPVGSAQKPTPPSPSTAPQPHAVMRAPTPNQSPAPDRAAPRPPEKSQQPQHAVVARPADTNRPVPTARERETPRAPKEHSQQTATPHPTEDHPARAPVPEVHQAAPSPEQHEQPHEAHEPRPDAASAGARERRDEAVERERKAGEQHKHAEEQKKHDQ